MTFKTMLIATTLLTCSLSPLAFAAEEGQIIIGKNVIASTDARDAASGFVDMVNRARYSLASKDGLAAKQNIAAAKTKAANLAKLSRNDRKVSAMQSGRVVYDTSKEGSTYYYPIETGSIATKEVGSGPFWAKQKGLGVKDAEFLYVTVDLSKIEPMVELDKATAKINDNKLNEADDILENMIDAVVSVEDSKTALAIKARDNLELARSYMAAENYDAARYPLKHAKSALKAMKGNKDYVDQQTAVTKYLVDIDGYQKTIESKDPTALEKMKEGWNQMWDDMKQWADIHKKNLK